LATSVHVAICRRSAIHFNVIAVSRRNRAAIISFSRSAFRRRFNSFSAQRRWLFGHRVTSLMHADYAISRKQGIPKENKLAAHPLVAGHG
jgi:hypothetical protein